MSAPRRSSQVCRQGAGVGGGGFPTREQEQPLFQPLKEKQTGVLRGCKIARCCSQSYRIALWMFAFDFHIGLVETQRHLAEKDFGRGRGDLNEGVQASVFQPLSGVP